MLARSFSVTFSEFLNRCLWRYLALKLIILFLTNHNAPRSVVCFPTPHSGKSGGKLSKKSSHFALQNRQISSLIRVKLFNFILFYKIWYMRITIVYTSMVKNEFWSSKIDIKEIRFRASFSRTHEALGCKIIEFWS